MLHGRRAEIISAAHHQGQETMTLFDLSGRVAVVTGGNGGIGLGYAKGLAGAGCTVSIWGRNEAKNAAAVETLTKAGGKAEARVCDVSNPAAPVRVGRYSTQWGSYMAAVELSGEHAWVASPGHSAGTWWSTLGEGLIAFETARAANLQRTTSHLARADRNLQA